MHDGRFFPLANGRITPRCSPMIVCIPSQFRTDGFGERRDLRSLLGSGHLTS